MIRYLKIGLIIAVMVVVGIFADFMATRNIGDIEQFYRVKTILSTINATLLISLLVTYVSMYKKLNSEFTIGLIVFSLILLLYALTSNPLLQWLFGFRAVGLGPFAMLPDLFATLALAVLFYLTMK